ncbi:MAG: hypothetical protein K8R23_14940 [Chthoniobacter sp.]|nr:hypothetical protein [Chthoniobacter sp.]
MKIATLTATALILAFGTPAVLAEEPAPAKCEMCEKMKKKDAAKAQQSADLAAQTAELDKLVTEMNGSLGSKKIEAMAAVVTRLVEQFKALSAAKAAPQTEPAKEAHQH